MVASSQLNGKAGFQTENISSRSLFRFLALAGMKSHLWTLLLFLQGKIGLISSKDGAVPDNGSILGQICRF
jgi:hypothetical protein